MIQGEAPDGGSLATPPAPTEPYVTHVTYSAISTQNKPPSFWSIAMRNLWPF